MNADAIGDQVLDQLKLELGEAWDKITPEERAVAARAARNLALLHAAALAGRDVERRLAHVNAQIAGLKSIGREIFARAFEKVLFQVAVIGGKVLRAIAIGALTG